MTVVRSRRMDALAARLESPAAFFIQDAFLMKAFNQKIISY